MGIETCGVEEWDEHEDLSYNRFESTPYRALDTLFAAYTPREDASLVDYGCGLGRVNFYFHHQWGIGGTGLEVHAGRLKRARANLQNYRRTEPMAVDVRFVAAKAEVYIPDPEASLFYFFNPFDGTIFAEAMARIEESLEQHDRDCDLVLYYPSEEYLDLMAKQTVFQPLYLVDLPWSRDPSDYFMVYRHDGSRV